MLAPINASDADEFRVQIALHDLRGDRRGAQPQFLADKRLHPRRKMRAGADRAGKFAHGHRFSRRFQALQRAAKFVVHQRHFQPKGGRLGMNAVAAANHRRELMFRAPWRR